MNAKILSKALVGVIVLCLAALVRGEESPEGGPWFEKVFPSRLTNAAG